VNACAFGGFLICVLMSCVVLCGLCSCHVACVVEEEEENK
jgi:hypothetical protein